MMMRSGAGLRSSIPAEPLRLTNASTPSPIENYTWQIDSTWCEGEGLTVHLPDGGSWQKLVENLEKRDAFGNVYVYFIDSVTEYGMPAGTSAVITLDGENTLLVYGDHDSPTSGHDNNTLSLTNTLPGSTEIIIQKVDETDNTKLLNARFKLLKQNADGSYAVYGDYTDIEVNGNSAPIEVVPGHYKLEETEFPAGYVRVGEPPEFDVEIHSETKAVEVKYRDNTLSDNVVQVGNQPGVSLPSTGGRGTTMFYILGSTVALLAAVLLITKRRAQNLQRD